MKNDLLDELHAAIWEAGKSAQPLEGYPVETRELRNVFSYGKDCATADIEQVVIDLVKRHLEGGQ